MKVIQARRLLIRCVLKCVALHAITAIEAANVKIMNGKGITVPCVDEVPALHDPSEDSL